MPIGRNRRRRWEGGVSMKTAAEYRAMAEECVAGEAYTDEVRRPLLQLAQIWLDSASQSDDLSQNGQVYFLRYRLGRDCARRGRTGVLISGGNTDDP